jgi:hypothetical protein
MFKKIIIFTIYNFFGPKTLSIYNEKSTIYNLTSPPFLEKLCVLEKGIACTLLGPKTPLTGGRITNIICFPLIVATSPCLRVITQWTPWPGWVTTWRTRPGTRPE